MLFEDLELSAHPGLADRAIERRDRLDDKALHAVPEQQVCQRTVQPGDIVRLEQRQHVTLDGGRDRVTPRMNALLGQRIELVERLPDEFSRPQSGIHQALDRAQLRDLVRGILALCVIVPIGMRKAVATFPDAQDVFGQPGFALDRADVKRSAGGFHQARLVGNDKRTSLRSIA